MTIRRGRSLYAIIFSSAIFAVTLVGPARSQIILDMSLITCKQYVESDLERQELIAAWMSGYFNASRNQPRVDFSRFARNKMLVANYCKRHKLESLMSAIQRVAF
jgi:acid stress chaperone HdeB